MPSPADQPTPERIFETLQGYQRTAVLEAAIDLDLFTAIDEGARTVPELAERLGAAERGVRSLCDYLTVVGFLTKEDGRYGLAPDAAAFLSRRSPACMASMTGFLLHPGVTSKFDDVLGAIRRGGGPPQEESTVATEWPHWVDFARSMVPLMSGAAASLAEMLESEGVGTDRVLDLAAGHGMYGISVAQRNPAARITAVDWAPVLEVARENAARAGVADRLETRPGDLFEVGFGDGHDVALATNILHHFDVEACTRLLRKVHAALKPGGTLATVEFVPNEDRVSPPAPALFTMQMLAGTPSGDAYTFRELDAMLVSAGFTRNECRDLPRSMERVVLSRR